MQSNESKDPVEEVPEMDRLENELAILNANIKDFLIKQRFQGRRRGATGIH